MSWVQITLRIFAGIIILVIIGLFLFYYSVEKAAQVKSDMIDELAKIPIGSSVNDVMTRAQKLGFKIDGKEFAIPSVIGMINEDLPQNKNILPQQVNREADLSNFKNGKLNFGLSLFLFSRKGCEFTFKDGVTKDSRIWWLD